MLKAILNRRSIRKYKIECIPKADIEKIINSGILAPSSKNNQPWNFIVVSGNAKAEMVKVIEQGFEREIKQPLLPDSAKYLSGAKYTLSIMKQAPVVIFIANSLGIKIANKLSVEDRVSEICNAQSIGAAIENMTLTATELGLGSLWICDTFFAQAELNEWLKIDGELYAALALGYADESPSARPRKSINDIVEWRE